MGFTSPPTFPVRCRVWISQTAAPPVGPPDYSSFCSVSPSRPSTWTIAETIQGYLATDIIRMPADNLLTDSFPVSAGTTGFPCSVIEAPSFSGNYYAVIWTHIVGRGFPNEFRRAICTRAVANFSGPFPP